MKVEDIPVALTFDDVLLRPQKSEILPKDVDLSADMVEGLPLSIPILSAAMDTVTESRMAIALAQEGGIGVVHKNLSPAEQASEVRKVKKSESGMIQDPITVHPSQPLADAKQIMIECNISGLPVVEEDQTVVGILTHRDVRFEKNTERKIAELMTSELVTAPVGVSLDEAKGLLHANRIEKLLVVDESGKLAGLVTIKDIEKAKKFPNAAKDSSGRLRVAAALGVGADFEERLELLVRAGADALVVDSAHGFSQGVIDVVAKIKQQYGHMPVIAGNIATAAGALALADAGASAVKVGMGPGSICTTRIVSGVGMPQISAIMEVREALAGRGVCIIADGGIRYSGDIVKALAAGANTVMVGSMFAGTEESPGEQILYQGRSYKVYRGMGSRGAMKAGSRDRYFQGNVEDSKLVPEGIEGRVPYKGSLGSSVYQLNGGIRSGMGYLGALTIVELQKRAQFVRVTPAGLGESHVHNVYISEEAPNYSPR